MKIKICIDDTPVEIDNWLVPDQCTNSGKFCYISTVYISDEFSKSTSLIDSQC